MSPVVKRLAPDSTTQQREDRRRRSLMLNDALMMIADSIGETHENECIVALMDVLATHGALFIVAELDQDTPDDRAVALMHVIEGMVNFWVDTAVSARLAKHDPDVTPLGTKVH